MARANGTGLYRLIDANHDDQFESNEVHFLKKFEGEGGMDSRSGEVGQADVHRERQLHAIPKLSN